MWTLIAIITGVVLGVALLGYAWYKYRAKTESVINTVASNVNAVDAAIKASPTVNATEAAIKSTANTLVSKL